MDLLSLNGLLWLIWVAYWYIVAWFVKATKSSESILGRMQHMLPLGIGFYLTFRRPPLFFGRLYSSPAIQWLGMALTMAGLARLLNPLVVPIGWIHAHETLANLRKELNNYQAPRS